MMKSGKILLHGAATSALVLILTVFNAAPATAATLEIQFTGLNISYDGTDITSKTSPDTLNTVNYLVDGFDVGSLTSDISIDLLIPDVTGIDIGGDTVISSAGGFMDLALDGDFLDLDLDEVTVSYLDFGMIQFVFGGSIASIAAQLLPDGAVLEDPVAVSFSTQVDPGTLVEDEDTETVASFMASGTGEVQGDVTFDPQDIPEPASMMLGLLAIAGATLGSLVSKGSW